MKHAAPSWSTVRGSKAAVAGAERLQTLGQSHYEVLGTEEPHGTAGLPRGGRDGRTIGER